MKFTLASLQITSRDKAFHLMRLEYTYGDDNRSEASLVRIMTHWEGGRKWWSFDFLWLYNFVWWMRYGRKMGLKLF